jgi:hypothetical protein
MTLLYVSEHDSVLNHPITGLPVVSEPPLAFYTVASGAAGPAFTGNTRVLRINADSVFSYRIGTGLAAGAATTSSPRISANETRIVGVNPGDNIAAVTNT